MNSSTKCRFFRTASKKRTPWVTIGSLWVILIHFEESESSSIESSIHPKGTRGTFSQTRRPTDVPASTFYLVKLVEDDEHVAPVITKWLSQDLVIIFFCHN